MAHKASRPDITGHDLPIGARPPGLGRLRLPAGRRGSVSDQVHFVLRRAILEVRLTPDESISENAICKQFAVSRSPVRAAIQRLAEEGLVDVSPQRGSYVAPIRLDGLRDSHFVRRTLELELLRDAARVWTPVIGAAMRAIIADQERCVANEDADGFFDADERFHEALVRHSDRPGVWAAIRAAKIPLTRFYRYWANKDRLHDVLGEHRAIIDALDRRDAEAAQAALATHLDMVFVIFDQMSAQERARLPFDAPQRETP